MSHTHTDTHTHTHTNQMSWAPPHTDLPCTYIHVYVFTYICIYIYMYILHTHTHTHMHARTHTHKHAHKHCKYRCMHTSSPPEGSRTSGKEARATSRSRRNGKPRAIMSACRKLVSEISKFCLHLAIAGSFVTTNPMAFWYLFHIVLCCLCSSLLP